MSAMVQGIKVIDVASNQTVPLPITPGTSLLASTPSQLLNGLNLDRLKMSACEMPEVVVPNHLLTLQLSPPHLFETWEEGQLRQIHKQTGSVTLAPSGFKFRGRWDRSVEILVLTLKPAVVTKCAIELHQANQTELVRCINQSDPQIWHIGLALEAELKQGNPNGQYFWESLTNAIAVRLLKHYCAFETKIQQ